MLIPINEMSLFFQALFILLLFVEIMAEVLVLVNAYCHKINRMLFLAGFGKMCIAVLILGAYTAGYVYEIKGIPENRFIIRVFLNCPYPILLALLVMIYGLTIYSALIIHQWINQNITGMSIKEAFDQLPSGICFFREDGSLLMANRKMHELVGEITGDDLMNTKTFWPRNPFYQDKEGVVWLFEERKMNDKASQLIASDVTKQYYLTQELKEDNGKLEQMNARLQEYSRLVDDVIRQEEQLEAKVRIHDDMGSALLATRAYLTSDKDVISLPDLLLRWTNNMKLMSGAALQEVYKDQFAELKKAAKAIGIEINIRGELKDSKRFMHALIVGARECLTNAAKHADAENMFITVTDRGEYYQIRYTNDGKKPNEPINEGGGLSSLRQMIERDGGSMTCEWMPYFALYITVRKDDDSEL